MPLQGTTTCSAILILERKASIGPCYRRGISCSRPSGITISVPKKSNNNINHTSDNYNSRSGINITISKKFIIDEKPNSSKILKTTDIADNASAINIEKDFGIKMKEQVHSNYYAHLREKLDNFCGKIKQAFHI